MSKQDQKMEQAPLHPNMEKWQKEFGSVFGIEVHDDHGQPVKLFFKRPDRVTMSAFMNESKTDEYRAMMILAENCLLNKEQLDFIKNTSVIFSISEELSALIFRTKRIIKKL